MKTFDNTLVQVIDREAASAELTNHLGEPAEFSRPYALVTNKSGKTMVLDGFDVAGWDVEGGKTRMPIYQKLEGAIAVLPKWEAEFTTGELLNLSNKTMPLAEFVKDRRGYNARIETNEAIITRWLNE